MPGTTKRISKTRTGATLPEYALIAALIAAALFGTLEIFGGGVNSLLNAAVDSARNDASRPEPQATPTPPRPRARPAGNQ